MFNIISVCLLAFSILFNCISCCIFFLLKYARDSSITFGIVRSDGSFAARSITIYSNQGGYASHGHALAANAANGFRMLYPVGAIKGEAYTVYTNLATAGAMRAYGIPQSMFALESHIDDICQATGLDPITIRKQNMMRLGYVDGPTTITCHSTGLEECIDRGVAYLDYNRKRKAYANQSGPIRRGVGMSIFCYKSGDRKSVV